MLHDLILSYDGIDSFENIIWSTLDPNVGIAEDNYDTIAEYPYVGIAEEIDTTPVLKNVAESFTS